MAKRKSSGSFPKPEVSLAPAPRSPIAASTAGEDGAGIDDYWGRNYLSILSVILVFCFGIRLFRVEQPTGYVYDEVYHAYTAKHIADGDPDAYDPWAKHPEGVAFEWTHPPVGKLMMAIGVRLFGDNSFGWRISSVIFGTGMVWLTALIATRIFGKKAGLLTAYLLSVETMQFVQSRTAMGDVHEGFFVVAAFFLYLVWTREPARTAYLLGAGLGVALAIATKWNGVVMLALLIGDFGYRWILKNELPDKNWVLWGIAAFFVIPVATYFISYTQYFCLGFSLENFVELQKQMYAYHMNLKNTHPSQSEVWQWLINIKPVYYYAINLPDDYWVREFNLGNHVVLWGGLPAVFSATRKLFDPARRTHDLVLLLGCYFINWLPWIASPRIKYFQHYLPAVPFLCILLAEFLISAKKVKRANGTERKAYYVTNTIIGAGIWMMVLYPLVAAVPLRKGLMEIYLMLVPLNPL